MEKLLLSQRRITRAIILLNMNRIRGQCIYSFFGYREVIIIIITVDLYSAFL